MGTTMMEMANYIMRILRSNLIVVWSWGFNNPVALPNGLRFSVQGFLHTGDVEVIYNEGHDLFDVSILDTENNIVSIVEGVYLDSLVNVIDGLVEKADNYKERVNAEYNLM